MLVAFDFDGTLSDDEMVELLGAHAGCLDEISDLTDRAMRGEIPYAESLRERVRLLAGLRDDAVEEAFGAVRIRSGAAGILRGLRDAGVTTAIITGGFQRGVVGALEREAVAVDRVVANELVLDDTVLSGAVEGPLIEGTKDDALARVAAEFGVALGDTVVVGDGANDVPMLEVAGLAVGFRPKPGVRKVCDVVVGSMAELESALIEAEVLQSKSNHTDSLIK